MTEPGVLVEPGGLGTLDRLCFAFGQLEKASETGVLLPQLAQLAFEGPDALALVSFKAWPPASRVVASSRTPLGASRSAIHVAPVLDTEDYDLAPAVVDAVQHSVSATPSRVDTSKVATQGLPDALRVVDQSTGEELDDGRGDSMRQVVLNCSNRGRSQDELVGLAWDHARRDFTASMPRTTSPSR